MAWWLQHPLFTDWEGGILLSHYASCCFQGGTNSYPASFLKLCGLLVAWPLDTPIGVLIEDLCQADVAVFLRQGHFPFCSELGDTFRLRSQATSPSCSHRQRTPFRFLYILRSSVVRVQFLNQFLEFRSVHLSEWISWSAVWINRSFELQLKRAIVHALMSNCVWSVDCLKIL